MSSKIPISFKVRSIGNYEIDSKLANKIADTLNKVKGRIDSELSQSGDLDVHEFIDYRNNKKLGQIPSLNIFNEEIETRGLDVYFLVDCSLSMETAGDQLRNLTATLFKALQKCKFINFNVIAFSSKMYSYHAMIQEIKKLDDCKYIVADVRDRQTPTPLILKYTTEKIKKMENKKLVILFTDGLPESHVKEYEELQEETHQEIVNMRNNKINFFTIFYKNLEYYRICGYNANDITRRMRETFKNTMYETEDFSEIRKILIRNLIKSVEGLNNG